jgi:tetratricopeptide (TPR) repeat protein
MATKSIRTDSTNAKIALAAAVSGLILFGFFTIKWSLANTIAKNSVYKEISQVAVDWSPNDPQTYYSLAAIDEKTLIPDDFPRAVENYEKAVADSPNNYLLWLASGRARERNGNVEGAEKALRKAVELAPNYSENHWTLGNILLRQGKNDEAFTEIRQAAETDDKYVNPAVSTAWQVFDGDISAISSKIGDSPEIKSALSIFSAKQQRFDEALNFWNALPENDKKTKFKQNGSDLVNAFIAGKKYRSASIVQSQISEAETDKITVGKFTNPSFETNVNPVNTSTFEWQLGDAGQPQIGVDNKQKHDGNQSLVIVFNSTDGKDFRQISQTVAVESGKKYQFQTFYRSELKANSTVKWEISDASDNKILASTSPISANSEWHNLTADFTTLPATEAVNVRLVRVSCGSSPCPISGKIWFDEFSLQ